MKKNIVQQSHSGFTLIETLVAIFIFSTALIALSGIASRGVSSVNRAKEVVTAEYLAQEGLEAVRFLRDNGTLANTTPWDAPFNASPNCTNMCEIRYPNNTIVPQLVPCNGACSPLTIVNGFYTVNSSVTNSQTNTVVPTNFVRTIRVRPLATNTQGEPIEYAVYSKVEWPVGVGQRSVEMTTTLTDWQTPLVY